MLAKCPRYRGKCRALRFTTGCKRRKARSATYKSTVYRSPHSSLSCSEAGAEIVFARRISTTFWIVLRTGAQIRRDCKQGRPCFAACLSANFLNQAVGHIQWRPFQVALSSKDAPPFSNCDIHRQDSAFKPRTQCIFRPILDLIPALAVRKNGPSFQNFAKGDHT